MKSNIINSLFFLLGLNVHGQFYPETNARWCSSDDDGGPPLYPVQYQMGLEPDTLINGMIYKRIEEFRNYTYTRKYYVRSDLSGKGYAYLLDSAAEFLTGDLSALVGDTVHDVLWSLTTSSGITYSLHDVLVSSIATLSNADVTVTRYYVNYSAPAVGTYFWEPGSGTSFGPMFEWTGGLGSAMVGDTVMFGYDVNGLPGPIGLELCMMLPMPNGVSEHNGARTLGIQPNPTTGRFTVTFPELLTASCYYGVYDALGKLLDQQALPVGRNTSEIDLSRFGAGSYLIKVSDPKRVWHAKVLLQ